MSSSLAHCNGHANIHEKEYMCWDTRIQKTQHMHKLGRHFIVFRRVHAPSQMNREVECDPEGICMSPDLHHHQSLCPPALTEEGFPRSLSQCLFQWSVEMEKPVSKRLRLNISHCGSAETNRSEMGHLDRHDIKLEAT